MTAEVGPRSTLALLTDRTFGPFIIGKVVSVAGVWLYNIVAALVAYEVSGSAFAVGMVSVAQWAPQLLSPLSGAAADRGDRRRQLVVGRVVAGLGCTVLAVWLAVVGTDELPGPWPVIGAAFVVGVGFLIGSPAMQSLIPAMVPPADLPLAVTLDSLPTTVSRTAGPALGAFLMVTAGPAVALAIAAATQFGFAIVVARLPVDGRTQNASGDRRIRAGLRHLRDDPVVGILLFGVAALGISIDAGTTLAPSLSESFGASNTLVGAFVSAFGAGALVGFLIQTSRRQPLSPGRRGDLGLWFVGAGLLTVGLSPRPGVAIAGFVVAGTGMSLALTGLTTVVQKRLPDEMRGRVMALWLVAVLGTRPLGAAINGAIADLASPFVAATATAVLALVMAWFLRPAQLRRRHLASLKRDSASASAPQSIRPSSA